MIRAGRVRLNGTVRRDPETPVRLEQDRIAVDGRAIEPQQEDLSHDEQAARPGDDRFRREGPRNSVARAGKIERVAALGCSGRAAG